MCVFEAAVAYGATHHSDPAAPSDTLRQKSLALSGTASACTQASGSSGRKEF